MSRRPMDGRQTRAEGLHCSANAQPDTLADGSADIGADQCPNDAANTEPVVSAHIGTNIDSEYGPRKKRLGWRRMRPR